MSKRPGVEASIRLKSITKKEIWEQIENQYKDMISRKGGTELVELDKSHDLLGEKLQSSLVVSDESEFHQTIHWKFKKGKPRPALWKYLKSNSIVKIKECSHKSFTKANSNDADAIKDSITEFCCLSGVGPATASAFLCALRPDIFAFMDDEVIECLHEKRVYTLKVYLDINSKCKALADDLGEGWTPYRVGRALWTAARIEACGLLDLTVEKKRKGNIKKEELNTRNSRRKVK